MDLNSKCSALANVRLEIFNEMEAGIKAQFLELMELRKRLRDAELAADLQKTPPALEPAPVIVARSA
jgi:hypothetical protein